MKKYLLAVVIGGPIEYSLSFSVSHNSLFGSLNVPYAFKK